MPPLVTYRRSTATSRIAVRFILTAAGVYAAALTIAFALIRLFPVADVKSEAMFPPVLWVTTGLLFAGSAALQRAVSCVRREKQVPFRRSLIGSLVLGTLFVGIQTYALRVLAMHQNPDEVQTGSNAFLTVIAALHAVHFTLALLFLVWITLNALADRYDHEYSWGVTLCALFWHVLGIVWCVIMGVFLIATR